MAITPKEIFYRHLAQTSPMPPALEIDRAEGIYLFDKSGKRYIDLIAGIAVSSTGHRHKEVMKAINKQLQRHLHVMVYGEFVLDQQVNLAKAICNELPETLNTVYFVNSGSEAVEGAIKLARRFTQRPIIAAFRNGYHGSTCGALSVMGNETLKQRFRPLIPGTLLLDFNDIQQLQLITDCTAAVILEPIQGEAGVVAAFPEFMTALRQRCNETGTLLVMDEIQTGIGRTGTMFAFEQYNIVPDILLLAKALGGGMPLGAFVASKTIMETLSYNPPLGHITTFGGHPVSCAAALANLKVVVTEKLFLKANDIAKIFTDTLSGIQQVLEIRNRGLMMAIQLESVQKVNDTIRKCYDAGLITDSFLFRPDALRVAPPLTIKPNEATIAANILRETIAS